MWFQGTLCIVRCTLWHRPREEFKAVVVVVVAVIGACSILHNESIMDHLVVQDQSQNNRLWSLRCINGLRGLHFEFGIIVARLDRKYLSNLDRFGSQILRLKNLQI
ncbi:hypothetical protein V6N13_101360 [Hibiscus sabdariffa]|uniref:Uncharacterized protein n=1 Tax=Hibiscus sabdariffa TaxID=183260 RepID=A0ABR2QL52_9ROSI